MIVQLSRGMLIDMGVPLGDSTAEWFEIVPVVEDVWTSEDIDRAIAELGDCDGSVPRSLWRTPGVREAFAELYQKYAKSDDDDNEQEINL